MGRCTGFDGSVRARVGEGDLAFLALGFGLALLRMAYYLASCPE